MSFIFGKISRNLSGFSKKFFIFVAIFAMSFVNFSNVFALEGAKWGGADKNSIIYNGKTYAKNTDSSKLPSDLRSGTAFISKSPASADGSQKAEAIIVNSTDSDSISGKFYNFEISATGNFKQNGDPQDITGQGVSDGTETNSQETNSCAVEGGGGWIVCNIANTIASGMDSLYNILEGFLKTQPLHTTSKSGLFVVWDYMRNIANVIFVIIFIIVIYSQITNIGVSNYGIKKILPKLIVAAILINLSYYICAIFVDLSNILGSQLQNLLVNIRKDIVSEEFRADLSGLSWGGLTTAVLAGIGYGKYAWVTGVATMKGAWFLILAILITVLYSVFVAVAVLAARQAIITVLVFLAPLAFAANILPNTEKWFEKWKDLLTTMLVMYPLMALLFGGSQLAGTVIIANANDNILTLILGMTVQVIPLAITPAIIKLSQGLLGRFAGMINNPNKGPIDSAKKWLNEGRENEVNKRIAMGHQNKNGEKQRNLTASLADMKHRRKTRHATNKNLAEHYQKMRFNKSEAADIEKATAMPEGYDKDKLLSRNTLYQQQTIARESADMNNLTSQAISGLEAAIAKSTFKIDAKNGEIIGIDQDAVKSLGATSRRLYNAINSANAYKEADQNNQKIITNSVAETLKRDENLQKISGGVMGESGQTISMARAFEQATKLSKEEVSAANSLMQSMNFSNKDYAEALHGKKVKTNTDGSVMVDNSGNVVFETDANGNHITLDYVEKDGVKMKVDKTLKKAAVETYMSKVGAPEALQILGQTESGQSLHDIRGAVVDALSKNKKDDFQVLGGAFLGQAALEGVNYNQVIANLTKGFHDKSSPEITTKMSDDALKIVLNQSMTTDQQIATAKNMFIINQTDLATKVKANQGSEIHDFINRLDPRIIAAAETEALAAIQAQNPSITAIDRNLSNIKKKP